MIELNCHSFETTIRSISKIFNVGIEIVTQNLKDIDEIKFNDICSQFNEMPDAALLRQFELMFGSAAAVDSVVYFHGSRYRNEVDLSEGLLPTDKIIEKIWSLLADICIPSVGASQWASEREKIIGDSDYLQYLHRPGPYAKLIRQSWFAGHNGSNHYIHDGPEIIKLICKRIGNVSAVDLVTMYKRHTRPAIVSFCVSENYRDGVGDALYYLWQLVHGEEPICDGGFNGGGEPVGASQILELEWLDDSIELTSM